jgi:hypothetical protein
MCLVNGNVWFYTRIPPHGGGSACKSLEDVRPS